MRWLIPLFCLAAAGCLPAVGKPSAATLFSQGVEEVAAGREPQSLTALVQLHPQSPWAERARVLTALSEEHQRLLERAQSAERELANCRRDARQNEGELGRLRQDLEKLKKLVIEMEKRAR
jgi:hypothetical protein